MLAAFLHGYLLSFGLILPLGPQNTFVFMQGAAQPKLTRALPVTVAASLCDTLLILLAVFGVSMMVLTLPLIKTLLTLIGAGFLLYIGWLTWKSTPTTNGQPPEFATLSKRIMFTLSVSLLNPHAILDTIGVIGTSSLNYEALPRAAFTSACIFNSWLWFLGLTVAGRTLGAIDRQGVMLKAVNKISAVIIWTSAVYLVASSWSLAAGG